MNRLKSFFYLLLCFALGVGLALVVVHLRAGWKSSEVAGGIGSGNAPPLRGFSLAGTVAPAVMQSYPPLHATAVAVRYAEGMDLAGWVSKAHQLNLQLVLLPPAAFGLENPYPHPLKQIAGEAHAAGVDVLCISWLNADPDADYWQGQIAQVRQAYSGRLLLAGQPDLLPGIEFLDKVDFVGAVGPFDLGLRRPTTNHAIGLHDVRTAWANALNSLESLCFRYGKQLILLDVTLSPPGQGSPANSSLIPLAYEALLTETKGRLGTWGLFMDWDPSPSAAGESGDEAAVNHYPDLLAEITELWAPVATPPSTTAKDDPDDADSEPQ